jgi:hypothetical protein
MVIKQSDGEYAVDLIEMKQERNDSMHVYRSCICTHTKAGWKVSGHFEYLENRSHGLDVTWQPVRGDLTIHL